MSRQKRNTTLRIKAPTHMSRSHLNISAALDEQQRAREMGLTIEVYRLQEDLRRLPLIPRRPWLRQKRARLLANLYQVARRDRCLSHINPWAASD